MGIVFLIYLVIGLTVTALGIIGLGGFSGLKDKMQDNANIRSLTKAGESTGWVTAILVIWLLLCVLVWPLLIYLAIKA